MAVGELFKDKSTLDRKNLILQFFIIISLFGIAVLFTNAYNEVILRLASTQNEKILISNAEKTLRLKTDPAMNKQEVDAIHKAKDNAKAQIKQIQDQYQITNISDAIGKYPFYRAKGKGYLISVYFANLILFGLIFYFFNKQILKLKDSFFFVAPVREKVLKTAKKLFIFQPKNVFQDPVRTMSFFHSRERFIKLLREMEASMANNVEKIEVESDDNFYAFKNKTVCYNIGSARVFIDKYTKSFINFLSFTGVAVKLSETEKKEWAAYFNFIVLHTLTGRYMNFPAGLINSYLKNTTMKYILSNYSMEKGIVANSKERETAALFLKIYVFWIRKSIDGKEYKNELTRFSPIPTY